MPDETSSTSFHSFRDREVPVHPEADFA